MDEDGFIAGEGGRIYGVKYGADVGYEIDMSLWGLALYAKIAEDAMVHQRVGESLQNHLYFVYPNGAIDGSWGIRSNKWTTYGSATADGCQILFSMFAEEDSRNRTAAHRNLEYFRGMISDGIIGYGPHYWDIFDDPPCVYPTFVRAKNLALAVKFGEQNPGATPPLPTEEVGWSRHFQTVGVVLARSRDLMATVTAYRYKDLKNKSESKYMHRPAGGSISSLWVKDHGFLQVSSPTEYRRWEPMHFPEANDVICLTPRIEFDNEAGYFTNLYEFDGRVSLSADRGRSIAEVSTTGELKDKNLLPGGVSYTWTHTVLDEAIEKSLLLKYRGERPVVRVIEPIVEQPGMTFRKVDPRTVLIQGEKRTFQLSLLAGDAEIELGKNQANYWAPYPAVKCYPVVLKVSNRQGQLTQHLKYRIEAVN